MNSVALAVGLLALLSAANVLWPRYSPSLLAVGSFFAGWLVGELPFHVILAELLVGAALLSGGCWHHWEGQLGLGLLAAALLLMMVICQRSYSARSTVADVFKPKAERSPASLFPRWKLLVPIPVWDPQVTRLSNLTYHQQDGLTLQLDVFHDRHARSTGVRPVVLFIHGGGWSISDKKWEGLPLLHWLVRRGFVGFSLNHRLSPQATFPDQIVDVKRAIAWVREHAAEYAGDASRLVIAGSSSGAHLAALAALTPNLTRWQPGFEAVDTSVVACLAAYGIYDLLDEQDHWHNRGMRDLLERHVLKTSRKAAPELYREASPISWITPNAPPFFISHGSCDTLVPVAEARNFVAALRKVSTRDRYLEFRGAQHAFEVFPSLRTAAMLEGLGLFLDGVLPE